MTISIGASIPSVTTKRMGVSGLEDFNLADFIQGKKVVIFGVPGAFTPSCAQKHLPGYVAKAADIKAKGVDEIICLAVNDPFVMKAWGESAAVDGKVMMVADGLGTLTKAMGLEFDGSGAGLGMRSKRFSMIVENGTVKTLEIEAAPSDVELSSAEVCLLKVAS